jgi:hypothetical protein
MKKNTHTRYTEFFLFNEVTQKYGKILKTPDGCSQALRNRIIWPAGSHTMYY